MKQYVLGIDFGTLSARALLADVSTGKEVADADFAYPHGVMTENDFPGSDLSLGTALQHPADYLQALPAVIKGVIDKTGINS